MKKLLIHRDGWFEGGVLEGSDEARTFACVRISVGDAILARKLSARGGGDSEAINVPLLPLARSIADSWWSLLYEPFRSGAGDPFRARHRLDVPMHGYVFPKIALCSGGSETVLAAWTQSPEEYARIEFLTPPSIAPEVLARDQAEEVLMDLVETIIARLDGKGGAHLELSAAWDRVKGSMGDPDELAYCKVAGRLGIDPYNSSGPDLTGLASGISETVFEDISEAAFVEELFEATGWVRAARKTWRKAPTIDLSAFGDLPSDQLDLPLWKVGSRAAETLRQNTGADRSRPRRHLEQTFGEVLKVGNASFPTAPASINALIERSDAAARVATVARSAREQRFKVCTAVYIAWAAAPGEDRAATAAFTRRQQAGRAFAAELLAPRDYLRSRAPRHGFTSDQIEEIAGDLICPYEAVVWQAYHADIPLRGVELPFHFHPAIV